MNKGFSLIEIIMYISLLSILIIGVFSLILSSFYNQAGKSPIKSVDYEILIKNYHVK